MRRYDDPVETRMGLVSGVEGPEQFLWRGRLWKVRAVIAHWVETGPWWQSGGARAVIGSDDPADPVDRAAHPLRPRPADRRPADRGATRHRRRRAGVTRSVEALGRGRLIGLVTAAQTAEVGRGVRQGVLE